MCGGGPERRQRNRPRTHTISPRSKVRSVTRNRFQALPESGGDSGGTMINSVCDSIPRWASKTRATLLACREIRRVRRVVHDSRSRRDAFARRRPGGQLEGDADRVAALAVVEMVIAAGRAVGVSQGDDVETREGVRLAAPAQVAEDLRLEAL